MEKVDIIEIIDIYATIHCIKLIKYIANNEKCDFYKLLQYTFSINNNELVLK